MTLPSSTLGASSKTSRFCLVCPLEPAHVRSHLPPSAQEPYHLPVSMFSISHLLSFYLLTLSFLCTAPPSSSSSCERRSEKAGAGSDLSGVWSSVPPSVPPSGEKVLSIYHWPQPPTGSKQPPAQLVSRSIISKSL